MKQRRSTALGPQFDAFLFAQVADDDAGQPLSLASMFGRLNLDPWREASKLMELPEQAAAENLAALIGALPDNKLSPADTLALAVRLVLLLPRGVTPDDVATAGSPAALLNADNVAHQRFVIAAVVLAMVIAFLVATHFFQADNDFPMPGGDADASAVRGMPDLR
jgi:hypothetical protein